MFKKKPLIVFEGIESSGKTTLINHISKYLKKPLLHSYYYPTEIRMKFLDKLNRLSPKYLDKVILLSAGTEATERAIKIARIYGNNTKKKY